MNRPTCPYCNRSAQLVSGKEIYPHRPDLSYLKFWLCAPCGAYTGTHRHSKEHAPKGRLANAELRAAKIRAHRAFDPIWKNGMMSRSGAYRWLQKRLGMMGQPHIGFMDVDECARVVATCNQYWDEDCGGRF